MLAAAANILAMFHLVKDMRARDKVLVIAFGVCAGFLIGDHLAFVAGSQPNLLMPILLGKLGGGMCGFFWCSMRFSAESPEPAGSTPTSITGSIRTSLQPPRGLAADSRWAPVSPPRKPRPGW